ncbi:MAG: antibiotic biosynthesis monooxygenase [Desulfobacteraceae bacterium]|nr:MAG: antibiotic biosynthesis monooxygenase [Desulfobacteraceae bacterium]
MSTTVVVSFQAKPDQVEPLLKFLSGVQARVIEAGCHSISLLQDQDDPTRIFEIEVWEKADGHRKFIEGAAGSGAFKPFDTYLAAPPKANYLKTVKRSEA